MTSTDALTAQINSLNDSIGNTRKDVQRLYRATTALRVELASMRTTVKIIGAATAVLFATMIGVDISAFFR